MRLPWDGDGTILEMVVSSSVLERPRGEVVAAVRERAAAERVRRSLARSRSLAHMEYCWPKNATRDPYVVGKHNVAVAAELDLGLERLLSGISTYLMIIEPFRHGKSEQVVRDFPGYAWGCNPDFEIMVNTYGKKLTLPHSRDIRKRVRSKPYQVLHPHIRVSRESSSVEEWALEKCHGKLHAVSVDGGQSGLGADISIWDDLIKNRAEAESAERREKAWDSLRNDTLTRVAPVHFVVGIGTRWHVDDPMGRWLNRNNPKHKDYDPAFPVAKVLHFPARAADGSYLFPERFPDSWYEMQFGQLGKYASAALLQGEPTIRGGNQLMVDRIVFSEHLPQDLAWVQYWDIASSRKERDKEDPDYTARGKVAYSEIDGEPWIFIKEVEWRQAEAGARNAWMKAQALRDGGEIWQAVESNAAGKDAYTLLRDVLKGRAVVHSVWQHDDKVQRWGRLLEPVMEAGHVVMEMGEWNDYVLEEMAAAPNGGHDDTVDACSGGAEAAKERWEQMHGLVGRVGRGAS